MLNSALLTCCFSFTFLLLTTHDIPPLAQLVDAAREAWNEIEDRILYNLLQCIRECKLFRRQRGGTLSIDCCDRKAACQQSRIEHSEKPHGQGGGSNLLHGTVHVFSPH